MSVQDTLHFLLSFRNRLTVVSKLILPLTTSRFGGEAVLDRGQCHAVLLLGAFGLPNYGSCLAGDVSPPQSKRCAERQAEP